MTTRKKVSNDDFLEAYGYPDSPIEKLTQKQKDNRNIMRTVINKYTKLLRKDDLESCALEALLRCLSYHDDTKGQKFTTSLWIFTDWECKRELRKQKKSKHSPNVISIMDFENFDIPDEPDNEESFYLNECIDLLSQEYSNLLREYYFDQMTMEQIGKKYGFSKETARQKINKAIVRLREIYLEKT